jgi:hypothetical protein
MAHRTIALLLLLPLLACGSAGPRSIDTGARVDRNSPATPIILQTEGSTSEHAIAAPADEVWRVLVTVFESLEIPVTELSGMRAVENRGYPARRIDGQRMSRFFECGSNVTGEIADSYRVTVSVRSSVEATSVASSVVVTELDAVATARDTRSGELHCSSKGTLERLIGERVREFIPGRE